MLIKLLVIRYFISVITCISYQHTSVIKQLNITVSIAYFKRLFASVCIYCPFKQAEFDIMYGEGISRISEILDMGVKYNFIEKAGSFYSYNSERMGQGEANARQWLKDHEDVQKELLDKIMARASGIAEEMTTGPIDDGDDAIVGEVEE